MSSRATLLRAVMVLVAGLLAGLVVGPAFAAEAILTVNVAGRTETHAAAALLAHPSVVTVSIPADVSYRRPMTYQAVPMATLLAGVPADASVRFVAGDGFATTITADLLLATRDDGPRAFLAVESPDAPWPPLRVGEPTSAGHFYLVWTHPERGLIVPEQWPYSVSRIEQTQPLAQRFPALAPAAGLTVDASVKRGYAVAAKNCLVCHTLNLAGDGRVGPDLNVPFNPTEYLRLDALRRVIRDPQSLRRWPGTRMPGFSPAVLSDRDLNDLLAYLRHMANRKVAAPVK
jgi:mono/diheme cytochrome c family protein